ncbi:MAG: glycolate oxidase subunit GlcF [Thiotrichales bacterium]|nr:glycolate oxidase subunit GlcF [Thiotrichales bacterium]
MKTELSESIRSTPAGTRADHILRKCVHCGFCNATCPTYQLLGDELDGPRGRIYLIKSLLEGNSASRQTRLHLDRCLTCRSCETTCPSGVEYSALLEIGREHVEKTIPAPVFQKLIRRILLLVLPNRSVFGFFLALGRMFRPLLPRRLKQMIPPGQTPGHRPSGRHDRRVILFQGCVQPSLYPATNAATGELLDSLGIACVSVRGEDCCGAIHHHLGVTDESRARMKKNIDLWWELLQDDAEAIVSTASGCGLMIRDYVDVLQDDPAYAGKARFVSEHCFDLAEFLLREDRNQLRDQLRIKDCRFVFQSPCTLQHGQKLAGVTEKLLNDLGVDVTVPRDAHLCCGSAGTYSILQPELSNQLRQDKIGKLSEQNPDVILTSNIGCQLHLQQASDVPVRHWVTLFREE